MTNMARLTSHLKSRFSERELILLVLILVAALILRIPDLTESLWFDELWSTKIKLGSPYALIATASNDIHPPFYLVFMFLWTSIFGDSELSIRFPPLLFGISSIALTYALSRQFIGAKASLIAAALVALSPAHIWYSQEARHYSALLAFTLLFLYSYNRYANKSESRTWLLIYAIAAFSMVFTLNYAIIYLVLTSLLSLYNRSPQKMKLLITNILIGTIFAFYLGIKIFFTGLETGKAYLRSFDLFELWMVLFNWFPTGNTLWPISGYSDDLGILLERPLMLAAHIFLASLLIIGIVVLLRKSRKSSTRSYLEYLAYLAILPLFMTVLALVGFNNIFIERSILTAMPIFYGIIALGLISIRYRMGQLLAGLAIAVISISSLVAFYETRDTDWTVYKPNPDWRSASVFLAEDMNGTANESIVLTTKPADVLFYYDNRFHRSSLDDQRTRNSTNAVADNLSYQSIPVVLLSQNPDSMEELLDTQTKYIYLLRNQYWAGNFDGLVDTFQGHPEIKQTDYYEKGGIQIHKYELVSENSVPLNISSSDR